MTAKNNRPAGSRTVEISWGDCNQSTARRRPIVHSNGAAIISIAAYMHWEIRRHLLETETPGLFGTYKKEDGAE